MTRIEDYKELKDRIIEKGLDIGVLIVNTKFNLMSPFKDLIKDSELENIINVSLVHPVFVTKCFLSLMLERGGG